MTPRRCGRLLRQTALYALLASAFALAGCERGGGSAATPAPPTAAAVAANPASAPASAAARAPAPPATGAAALAGIWRQLCQPYLPGDGASDISYTVTLKGADRLHLAGVARDYKDTTCSGAGTVIATPEFTQKIVGQATLGGVPVLRLVDEAAAVPAPADSQSIVGIDQGRLRFGAHTGPRDGAGFPAQFEKPGDAYNRQ